MKQSKRAYSSSKRKEQALKTQQAILHAAKKLFQQKGFDTVTLREIAEEATVSLPTIFALFKSKQGLLQEILDQAIPKETFNALAEASFQKKHPEEKLAITAKMARTIYEGEAELIDLLRGASTIASACRNVEKAMEERRYERQETFVESLYKEGFLKKTLSLKEAKDLLWALTGRDLYRLLVLEKSWSPASYEVWLHKQLLVTLLT